MGLLDGWSYTAGSIVQIRNRSAYTDYGRGSYGTATTVSCVIQYRDRVVQDAKGRELQSSVTVLLKSAETLSDGLQISFDTGTTWVDAVQIIAHRDAVGNVDHYEVLV